MKKNPSSLQRGLVWLTAFALFTLLVHQVDVRSAGPNGSSISFAAVNLWFHRLTGVHMPLYLLTDWLGLIPLFVCVIFAGIGLIQWIRRKHLLKVDPDILLLGVHYAAVILVYLLFETFPVNYRPVLIDGRLESSYPSSTTLLVLGVMPTLILQAKRRIHNPMIKNVICASAAVFSALMVLLRLLCGVHWLTDVAGAVMLSAGLLEFYRAANVLCCKK